MNESIQSVLLMMAARLLFEPNDLNLITDEDLMFVYNGHKEIIDETSKAIELVLSAELEQRFGRAISTIRNAEGIDPDQIDQILGVERDDL